MQDFFFLLWTEKGDLFFYSAVRLNLPKTILMGVNFLDNFSDLKWATFLEYWNLSAIDNFKS